MKQEKYYPVEEIISQGAQFAFLDWCRVRGNEIAEGPEIDLIPPRFHATILAGT